MLVTPAFVPLIRRFWLSQAFVLPLASVSVLPRVAPYTSDLGEEVRLAFAFTSPTMEPLAVYAALQEGDTHTATTFALLSAALCLTVCTLAARLGQK